MKSKTRGSTLTIVLVIFLLLTTTISSLLYVLSQQTINYKNTKLMFQQKNLEILLTKYYIQTEKDDILFSDEYDDEKVNISYTVDIAKYEEVTTVVHFKKEEITYKWLLIFDQEDYHIIRCQYID